MAGFELGPGWQRKPPKGWVPVRLTAREHGKWIPQGVDGETGTKGETVIDTVAAMRAVWQVEGEGVEPYEVTEDDRRAPMWITSGLGGKRWYSVATLKYTHGFMNGVAIPAYVNPKQKTELWIDWDGAYERHVEEWDRKDRVEREIAARSNPVDKVTNRVLHPFSKKLKEGEEHLVDEELGRRQEKQEEIQEKFAEKHRVETQDRWDQKGVTRAAVANTSERIEQMERLKKNGVDATAKIISIEETDTKVPGGNLLLFTLDVGEGRTVVYEHIWGKRHAKYYKVGRILTIKMDPENPDFVELA